MKYIVAIFLVISILSCQIEPIEGNGSLNDLPAVSGYVTPNDSVVKISVRRLLSLNTPENIFSSSIKDAFVQINYQDKNQQLQFDEKEQSYRGIAYFKPNDKVSLLVRFPNNQEATAETTIPGPINNIEYRYLNDRLFEMSWENPEKTSYFALFIHDVLLDNRKVYLYLMPQTPPTYHIKSLKGAKITSVIAQYTRDDVFLTDNYKRAVVTLGVAHLDSSFYHFDKSAANQDIFSGNPFQENTPIFNNIKGGVGIFGSYYLNKINVKLTKQ